VGDIRFSGDFVMNPEGGLKCCDVISLQKTLYDVYCCLSLFHWFGLCRAPARECVNFFLANCCVTIADREELMKNGDDRPNDGFW